MPKKEASDAVLKVGDGCGFVVETSWNRLVITAAHCLPYFPPCASASSLEERTFKNLLSEILGKQPSVWAECLFVDPISDLAVLGPPDNQALPGQAEAYELLTRPLSPMPIADAHSSQKAWLRDLDGRWHPCTAGHNGGAIFLLDAKNGIKGGMSGSPIVSDDGAIGVVCVGGGPDMEVQTEGGPNPRLTHHLPAGLLRDMESHKTPMTTSATKPNERA